jgi:replicative DNA helicase
VTSGNGHQGPGGSLDEARQRRQNGTALLAPHSVEAETAVLGTMLQLGSYGEAACRAALAGLSAEDFYSPAHGHVFEAIARLVDAGHPADAALVVDQLRRDDLLDAVGGPMAVMDLLFKAPAASGAPRWVQTVAELADQRREQAAALELAQAAAAGDDTGRLRAREELERLAQRGPRGRRPGAQPPATAETVLADLLEDFAHPEDAVTVATGIPSLDRMLAGGGWRPGLFLLAAGPGVGKSAFALQSCLRAVAAAHVVLYVSIEQSPKELVGRIFCRELEAPIASYWNRDPGLAQGMRERAGLVNLARLHIQEDPYVAGEDYEGTVGRVRRWTAELCRTTGRKPLVVVDYLQRLRPAEGDRRLDERLRVSMACLGLRQLARDLEVPVLAISSVGRTSYSGQAGLDWFKGSGDLEYDADCCLLLKPKDDNGDGPARSSAIPVDLHVMKSRYGELTFDRPINLVFDRRYGTFREPRASAGGAPPPPPRLVP